MRHMSCTTQLCNNHNIRKAPHDSICLHVTELYEVADITALDLIKWQSQKSPLNIRVVHIQEDVSVSFVNQRNLIRKQSKEGLEKKQDARAGSYFKITYLGAASPAMSI